MIRPVRAIAALAVLGALASGCASARSAPPVPAPAPSVGQQLDATVPPAVDNEVFVASTGQRLSLASLSGKVLVVSDMMTLCQETCPLDTANTVAAARAADSAGLGNRVEFLSITIDPQRDTPTRLAAYRRLYAPAPPNWLVLTGTSAGLSALWKTLGVYIQKVADTPPAPRDWLTGKPLTYDLTHSDELFFLDAKGQERFLLDGVPHVAAGAPIPTALRKFLDAKGQQQLAHPGAQAWTLPQALRVISWLTGHKA